MTVTTLGIDLVKNIFQLHGVDMAGKVVVRKKLRRKDLIPFISQLPPCAIAIEACSTSYFWTRQFKKYGHTVRAIMFTCCALENKNPFPSADEKMNLLEFLGR